MFKKLLWIFITPVCFANIASDFSSFKNYAKNLRETPFQAIEQFNPQNILHDVTSTAASLYNGVEEQDELAEKTKEKLANDKTAQYIYNQVARQQKVEVDAALNNSQVQQDLSNIFCADGNCIEKKEHLNQDFMQDAAKLAALNGIAAEFSAISEKGNKEPLLFGGKAYACKIHDLKFLDCCSQKGWGEKLNLAHCQPEDRTLGEAKLNYLVHYLGKYCAKHWPKPFHKTCKVWKNAYCIFDSKLARLIQEEGRLKQIDASSLGSAKNPNCSGLTVSELQHIDMRKIEFINPVYPFSSGIANKRAGIADSIVLNNPKAEQLIIDMTSHIQERVS